MRRSYDNFTKFENFGRYGQIKKLKAVADAYIRIVVIFKIFIQMEESLKRDVTGFEHMLAYSKKDSDCGSSELVRRCLHKGLELFSYLNLKDMTQFYLWKKKVIRRRPRCHCNVALYIIGGPMWYCMYGTLHSRTLRWTLPSRISFWSSTHKISHIWRTMTRIMIRAVNLFFFNYVFQAAINNPPMWVQLFRFF